MLNHIEKQAIQLLLHAQWPQYAIQCALESLQEGTLEHTGNGYFYTLPFVTSYTPYKTGTYHEPIILAEDNELYVSFIVYISTCELTLECHGWGANDIPCDIRNRALRISIPQWESVKHGETGSDVCQIIELKKMIHSQQPP